MIRKVINIGMHGIVCFLCFVSVANADIEHSEWKTDDEIDQFYGDAAEERGAASQHAALAEWKEKIGDAERLSPDEAIPFLGKVISKTSKYNIFQVPERMAVFYQAQTALLSIPGHARYYADEIKREQEEVKELGLNVGKRVDYDRNRSWHFGTLRYLPSPETIQVLGEFLSDRKDIPKGSYPSYYHANDMLAVQALIKIGLRDSPQKEPFTDGPMDLKIWKDWWEEVKTGQRTFSFNGQKVEYRFNPDGTWETIAMANPPADGIRLSKAASSAVERELKRPRLEARREENQAQGDFPWQWIIGGSAAALVLFAWLLARRAKS